MQELVAPSGPKVQPIDFRDYFVHLTFIDERTVRQDGIPRRIAFVSHAGAISAELSARPENAGEFVSARIMHV
jgi:hypothetical protein